MLTGKDLIEWGHAPGAWFKDALITANEELAKGRPVAWIEEQVRMMAPKPIITIPLQKSLPYATFLRPRNDAESDNLAKVAAHMDVLMKTPTIRAGAVMPDACPAGNQMGTIPVGGIVATENAIHPGFHSADICCSMMVSVFDKTMPTQMIMDTAMQVTHFGATRRSFIESPYRVELLNLIARMERNPFLKGLEHYAQRDFMTQGDGNHFFFVGEWRGETAIVTHHGSRGLGAQLYKRGKTFAEAETKKIAPEVPAHNAWITADTQAGEDYWQALQFIRLWTKLNHLAIHDGVISRLGRRSVEHFWNEHNFVFRRTDGLFYHAKGATPVYDGFSYDTSGHVLIPLNMGSPILVGRTRTLTQNKTLGFAPHGAGRNVSRTQMIRELLAAEGESVMTPELVQRVMKRSTDGLDIRFYTGRPDVSELPMAYKDPIYATDEIVAQDLVPIVGAINPLGTIMAGEVDYGKFRKKEKANVDPTV